MSNQRNADKDREIIAAATEGPWHADPDRWPGNEHLQYWVQTHYDGIACSVRFEDTRFFAEAREAFPHWLERAVSAEQRVAELEKIVAALDEQLTDAVLELSWRRG